MAGFPEALRACDEIERVLPLLEDFHQFGPTTFLASVGAYALRASCCGPSSDYAIFEDAG